MWCLNAPWLKETISSQLLNLFPVFKGELNPASYKLSLNIAYHTSNMVAIYMDIPVAAGTVVRLISDWLNTVAPPPSWVPPNSILTNFTDNTVNGVL